MKTKSRLRRFIGTGFATLAALLSLAALDKGGTAFAKKNETSILAEPKPLAAATGKVGFAEELKVEEVRGSWLRVKTKKVAGWIFAGNVADEKPTIPPPAFLTSVKPSETNTAAAARPLADAAKDFATRHNSVPAQTDVEWLDQEAAGVKPDEVDTYLRDNQKGEFRP